MEQINKILIFLEVLIIDVFNCMKFSINNDIRLSEKLKTLKT